MAIMQSKALDILWGKLHAIMLVEPRLGLFSWKSGEEEHCQRRYHQRQGVGLAVVRHRGGLHRSQVPIATSPIGSSITVEHFAPHTPVWGSYSIVRTRYRREVAHHQHR